MEFKKENDYYNYENYEWIKNNISNLNTDSWHWNLDLLLSLISVNYLNLLSVNNYVSRACCKLISLVFIVLVKILRNRGCFTVKYHRPRDFELKFKTVLSW